MSDQRYDDLFEQRLARGLVDFGEQGVRPFDAIQITRLAAARAERSWFRLPALPRSWRPLLAMALLALGLIGAGILGGFIKLPNNQIAPNPSYQPFSPLPTLATPSLNPDLTPDPNASPGASASPIFTLPPIDSPTPQPTTTATPPIPTPTSAPTASPTPLPTPSPSPAGPLPVNKVVAVTMGDTHACALADDGRVFCWGLNDEGQLGDGTTDDRDYGTVAVVGIDDATAIAAGIRFSCAVRAGGTVWCWGEDPGQDPSTTVPRQVVGISDATAVAAGGAFACALRATHQVACWGVNSLGQLGTGTFSAGEAAAQPVDGLNDAVELTAGWNHACVVRTDQSVWCWGGNGDGATGYGQLGDGTLDNSAVPVQVAGLTNIVEVEAGGWTTCARSADGETYCWGYGEEGTLGDGNQANSSVPVQPGISDARHLAVGRFLACVSRADQSVWCWGDTTWSPISRPATTPVEGTRTRPDTISALAVNRYVVLLDNSGRVWSWASPTPAQLPIGP